MEPEDNGPLMHRMVDFFRTGDLSDLESVVSADYVDHQGVGQGALLGTDGFTGVVDLSRTRHPQLDVEIEELTVLGNLVVAKLTWTEPSASRARIAYRRTIEAVRFAKGLAVEHWGARLD